MALPNGFFDVMNKWAFRLLILAFAIFALCALVAIAVPDIGLTNEALFVFVTLVAQLALFAGGILAIAWLLSGMAILPKVMTSRKKKVDADHVYQIQQDDARLDEILKRLDDDEQAYIREQLALKRMGLSSDGELVELDDI